MGDIGKEERRRGEGKRGGEGRRRGGERNIIIIVFYNFTLGRQNTTVWLKKVEWEYVKQE